VSHRGQSIGDACACAALVAAALVGCWFIAAWITSMPLPR
jgi:hypothetical protein